MQHQTTRFSESCIQQLSPKNFWRALDGTGTLLAVEHFNSLGNSSRGGVNLCRLRSYLVLVETRRIPADVMSRRMPSVPLHACASTNLSRHLRHADPHPFFFNPWLLHRTPFTLLAPRAAPCRARCAQTSQNRFWMLPFLCKRWPGPISIAILEEDREVRMSEHRMFGREGGRRVRTYTGAQVTGYSGCW